MQYSIKKSANMRVKTGMFLPFSPGITPKWAFMKNAGNRCETHTQLKRGSNTAASFQLGVWQVLLIYLKYYYEPVL